MEYDENLYWATVTFPDKAFFNCIYYLMRKSVGLNIQDIGNIDLSDTLKKNLFDEWERLWSSTGKSL